jgi:regulator of protease activity HflC (stomatin/prohibitin superfamily)
MAGRPNEGDKLGNDAIYARTSDGQLVIIDTTMLFKIDADLAVDLHINWQDRYIRDFIRPGLRAFVRSQASKFTVDEINSHKRKAFEDALNELAKVHCQNTGVQPHVILVRNITFSPEYATSVEEKMTALQRVTEAEYKAKQVANLARGDAEKIKIKARAEADAIRVTAEARANAHLVKAEAEAEALELIARSLEQRDNLLTYRYIDKLSPNIKAMLLPSNAPLILPMPQLENTPQEAALPAAVTPPLQPQPAPPAAADKPLLVEQSAANKPVSEPAVLSTQ